MLQSAQASSPHRVCLPGPPDAGRGMSDGKGTYKRITRANYDGGEGKAKPNESTFVEEVEDEPHTPEESTVVEKGKAGRALQHQKTRLEG